MMLHNAVNKAFVLLINPRRRRGGKAKDILLYLLMARNQMAVYRFVGRLKNRHSRLELKYELSCCLVLCTAVVLLDCSR